MKINQVLERAGLRSRFVDVQPAPGASSFPEFLDQVERELGIHPILTETAERSADGEPLAVVSGEPEGVQNGN